MTTTFVPFSEYDWTIERHGWLPWNPVAYCLIASFCAIAFWISIEVLIHAYAIFKRHSGLYFLSIIITTAGIILQTIGYILKAFENNVNPILVTVICKIGWVSNVTGFSIVLWSRLHLVVNNQRMLHIVMGMILINAFLCHTPIVVLEFGLTVGKRDTYLRPMHVFERIQQLVFTLQETFISSMYIYHTFRFLKLGYPTSTRKVIGLLVGVQLLVMALDTVLTTFDFLDKFVLKYTLHPFVYAVKVKLEFIVLNQLQTLVRGGISGSQQFDIRSTAGPGKVEAGQTIRSTGDDVETPRSVVAGNGIADLGVMKESLFLPSPAESSSSTLAVGITLGNPYGWRPKFAGSTSTSLQSTLGRSEVMVNEVDNLERAYLGSWKSSV